MMILILFQRELIIIIEAFTVAGTDMKFGLPVLLTTLLKSTLSDTDTMGQYKVCAYGLDARMGSNACKDRDHFRHSTLNGPSVSVSRHNSARVPTSGQQVPNPMQTLLPLCLLTCQRPVGR